MTGYRGMRVGLTVALAISSAALAGPNIDENTLPGGDAGSLPNSAAKLTGVGPLDLIKGKLDGGGPGPTVVPDFEDMYQIFIADPAVFSARTEPGPLFPFNTQLWLFGIDERGILANDDDSTGMGQSLLLRQATDGTPASVDTPGLYYIAITGFDNDPLGGGLPIFNQVDPFEISGPDGPGGPFQVSEWTGPPAQIGDYFIFFTGVEFVPEPVPTTSEWGLVVMGLLLAVSATVVFARRTRAVRA